MGESKSNSRERISRFLALILGLLPMSFAHGDEPLPVCALPAVSAEGLTLLLDPVDHSPIALLSDPDARLHMNRWHLVLQTVWENPDAAGLPRLRLADALPEFWAQPAALQPFLRGPGAYSGMGTELRARDWAGLPATDRRSYRLDPGLRDPTSASVAPPRSGSSSLQVAAGAFRLVWNGVAGRVYQVHYTASLSRPFELIQTLIASDSSEIQIPLPAAESQGFYRLAEVAP